MFTVNKSLYTGCNRLYFTTAIVLLFAFTGYYLLLLYLRIGTDIQVHAEMALQFFRGNGNITPNFLYYFLVALLAGFSKYKMAYYLGSVLLLSTAVTAKFVINVYYLQKFTSYNRVITTIVAVMLLFVFSLPGMNFFENKDFYLGQLTPNVWHNSTVIFLAPFSVVLFFETIRFLNGEDSYKRRQLLILLLVILNAVIKPSFLFTIIPVVLLFFVYRGLKNGFRRSVFFILPYLGGLLFIALEYFFIYKLRVDQSVLSAKEASSVIVSPFEMWSHFSVNMPVAFITSCLFPVVYVLYTKGSVLKDRLVCFAGINFLIAILIWILFIETGFRRYHGNFYWQLVIANYLLFFSMLIHLLQQAKGRTIPATAFRFLFGIFAIHFLWGIIYFAKIIWFHGYS